MDHFHQFKATDESGFEWGREGDDGRFKSARNGDHLLTPFQCDLCLFRLLKERSPVNGNSGDELLLCCLRRANLDALWGRESSTVQANRRQVNQILGVWQMLGIQPTFPELGPFPLRDDMGIGVAVAMLMKSLEPGRYGEYSQFETIRKLRSAYSNVYHASSEGVAMMASLGRDTTKTFLTRCPTQSLWFERFAKGCVRRMGQEVRQDLAISIGVMHKLLEELDTAWTTTAGRERAMFAGVGAYCVIAFCGSFRGHEVFLVDLFGLLKYADDTTIAGEEHYVMIPLLGRFKGEDGSRYHLTPLASVTRSKIEVKTWVKRLCEACRMDGRTHGPAFGDRFGGPIKPRTYEMIILDCLQKVQDKNPDLIRPEVNVYEEYGLSRSFRRGATTEAKNQGVTDSDIDLMNRWRNVENARGRKARLRMQDHYSDIRQLVPSLLRFSKAL